MNVSVIVKDGATDMRNGLRALIAREIDTMNLGRLDCGERRHCMALIAMSLEVLFPGGAKVVMNPKTESQLPKTLNLDTETVINISNRRARVTEAITYRERNYYKERDWDRERDRKALGLWHLFTKPIYVSELELPQNNTSVLPIQL
ncbi:MAG: hypothetical protein Q9161_007865 [Pseudevernia consocians]